MEAVSASDIVVSSSAYSAAQIETASAADSQFGSDVLSVSLGEAANATDLISALAGRARLPAVFLTGNADRPLINAGRTAASIQAGRSNPALLASGDRVSLKAGRAA
jgi:hypothetical protein